MCGARWVASEVASADQQLGQAVPVDVRQGDFAVDELQTLGAV